MVRLPQGYYRRPCTSDLSEIRESRPKNQANLGICKQATARRLEHTNYWLRIKKVMSNLEEKSTLMDEGLGI
jgi:hypothetical protein